MDQVGGIQWLVGRQAELVRQGGGVGGDLVEAGNRARLPDFSPVRIEGAAPEAGRPALFHLVSRTASELVGHSIDGLAL